MPRDRDAALAGDRDSVPSESGPEIVSCWKSDLRVTALMTVVYSPPSVGASEIQVFASCCGSFLVSPK